MPTHIKEQASHMRLLRPMVAILLVAAASWSIWRWVTAEEGRRVTDAAGAKIRVRCDDCNAAFDMPFVEYNRLTPRGTDVSGPIDCPRCGESNCLTRAGSPRALAADQNPSQTEHEDRTARPPDEQIRPVEMIAD